MKAIATLTCMVSLSIIFSSCSPSIEKSTKQYFYKHRKESDQLFELASELTDSSQHSVSLNRSDFTKDSIVTFFFWDRRTNINSRETPFSTEVPFSIKDKPANSDTFLVSHNYFIGKEKMNLLATTFFHSRYLMIRANKDYGIFLGYKDNPDFARSPEMIGIFYAISGQPDMKRSKKLEENIYLDYLNMGP